MKNKELDRFCTARKHVQTQQVSVIMKLIMVSGLLNIVIFFKKKEKKAKVNAEFGQNLANQEYDSRWRDQAGC